MKVFFSGVWVVQSLSKALCSPQDQLLPHNTSQKKINYRQSRVLQSAQADPGSDLEEIIAWMKVGGGMGGGEAESVLAEAPGIWWRVFVSRAIPSLPVSDACHDTADARCFPHWCRVCAAAS